MKTQKQQRESLAATNKSIQDKNRLLKAARQKLKRVDLKVCINKQLIGYYKLFIVMLLYCQKYIIYYIGCDAVQIHVHVAVEFEDLPLWSNCYLASFGIKQDCITCTAKLI